jgi:hypothetical protein
MNEITLQTDLEVGSTSILIGNEPRTGFPLYRRFRRFELNTETKEHTVQYEEWLLLPDGKVYDRFYRWQQFKAVNITDVNPPKLRYNQWLSAFMNQFGTNINNVITSIPITSNGGDVVQ